MPVLTTLTTDTVDLVPWNTTQAVSPAVTTGVADMRTALGGFLTLRIANGGTGPTVQCVGRVLISHATGATPAAAAAGQDWKTIWTFGGGTSNNAVTESGPIDLPFGTKHVQVRFDSNTVQAVTVEAVLSRVVSASST
jgi:hypothetical protein